VKKIGKLALLLAVIATLMTFALSEINIVTKPLILQQQFEKNPKCPASGDARSGRGRHFDFY
jgi:Na+-translocating ferredoxin:NAD+ oxidoreductase RnfG subunit